MAFKSLSHILRVLENQAQWQEQQEFLHLQKCWSQVVGPGVMKQTRPMSIQRQVLRVATSSSVWAQTLTFERRRILEKLNPLLPRPLVDIRFFTDGWANGADRNQSTDAVLPQCVEPEHPSVIPDIAPAPKAKNNLHSGLLQTADEAFQDWAETIRARSHSFPLCRTCQCPTPAGELQRWSVCALCAAKLNSTSS
jgi:predicted nucleic acid-binding Zn ribbon protein